MSSKFWSLGVFILTLVFCVSGCKSCGSGRDPLLGKTRVDPPTTNARSVYVERQNVNECGVVPGGGSATAVSPEIPASSDPAGIIQPGAGSVQKSYYPSGLDSVDESVPVPQDEPSAENAYLHWLSAEVPQNAGPHGPSLSDLGTHELTEEELANYRYVYDFSVMPPRKVPVGRSAGAGPTERPFTGNGAVQGSSPDPYVPHPRQFVSEDFDPYAPNRQFERRKAKLSRTMASEFDEAEANSSPYSVPGQTANYDSPRNETTYAPEQVAQTQISAKDSGWRVIASPDPVPTPSASPLSNEAVAESQVAPVQQSVGTKAQVPEKGPQKTSAPEKVSEKVGETVPQSPKMDDDSAVDLFDLPRK
ncbi:MAG: hypothetical protein K6C40_11360 [Thermoguttaceae bacterium]|nr:hypothetical protein [Thermoguttaceae bacterium]